MVRINGKYTTIRYKWMWIMLVQVMMEHDTSKSIRSRHVWDNSMMNHVSTNTHTDGIVNNNVAHRNQVFRPNIVRGNMLSSHDKLIRIRGDTSASGYFLSSGNNNACKLLSMKEIHDDNRHAECDTARLIVECENVSMHNISPTRTDGRGVSTGRFTGTHPISLD